MTPCTRLLVLLTIPLGLAACSATTTSAERPRSATSGAPTSARFEGLDATCQQLDLSAGYRFDGEGGAAPLKSPGCSRQWWQDEFVYASNRSGPWVSFVLILGMMVGSNVYACPSTFLAGWPSQAK